MVSIAATNLVAFVIVLGFLVFAHESGHFLFAKLFRVRVFVFSFGFGRRLFGFKRGDTDYRVSLIPLGGYVRMAGESAEEERGGDAHEFLSKPKWQRFLILFAGPGVNLVIAVLFLAFLNTLGFPPVPKEASNVIGEVIGKPAIAAGMRPGDTILAVNDDRIAAFEDFQLAISMSPQRPVKLTLLRQGKTIETTIVPERVVTDYGVIGRAGVKRRMSSEVGKILPGSAADRAGIREGDFVVAAEGQAVTQLDQLVDILDKAKGRPVGLTVRRGTSELKVTLPAPRRTGENYPGISFPTVSRKMSWNEAFRTSIDQNVKMVKFTFATLGRLLRLQGSAKDFSGPLQIARISGEMLRTGWKELVYLMATISLQLGIMNLLPIPVLDGGHILILLIEGIAGRELSMMTKERITKVGFAIIASLMIFVLCNDVIQTFMRARQ